LSPEIQTLQQGVECFRAGRLQDASRLYGEVLRRNPQNADALHLLGLVYLESGQPEAAAGLVSRAIQQRPDVPLFYNTLGNAFRGLRRFEPALLSFRKAISLEPDFAEALANFGSALEESGRPAEAVPCLRRAVELRPECAEIHGNLGNALRSSGAPREARAAYEAALRLRPDYAEGWMNLGNLFFDRGKHRKAEEHYRKALSLNPRLSAARNNLGSALAQMGQFQEAEAWCLEALQERPGDPAAQCNLASVLAMTGRPEAAEQLCRQALESDPSMPEAHTNLGLALSRLHRFAEAESHCRRSLELRPDRPTAHANLARVLLVTGRFSEAEEYLRKALELGPDHLRVIGCYGDLCAAQLDYAGALSWYGRALELAPEDGLTRAARSMAWLAMGDFARGWEEYEFRWKMADCRAPEFIQPQWDGRPLCGRTLLLHTEQGLGDTIQFVRFAALARQSGGRVVLACQPALLPILSEVAGVDCTVPDVDRAPNFDYHLPLLSLPRVLGCREHNIPCDVPYLKVPAQATVLARRRLEERCGKPDGRLRVGIAWAGNRKHPNDANRSMRLEQLAPLLETAGAQFFSLQQGHAIPPGFALLPLIADSDPIDVTGALVMELDLVISVDSLIAHLAGALGREVWTLLPFAPDWRWMTGREDSPWYPDMRLFRQPRFGDWADVVRRVRVELCKRIDRGY
jgi:tetratricopeptide (TPR) repeat protein